MATGGGKSVFTLSTSDRSTFIALLDLNGTAGYQAGTADVLLEQSGPKGTRTVEWNGLNGLGQKVAQNASIAYAFRNGSSPLNFPMWDAEISNGFRVEDVRPVAGSNFNSLLFWDDSNLSATLFPAPQSQLFGAAPASGNTAGLHAWGSTSSASATYNAGDLKTVNTWTYGYTNEISQTAPFAYDCSAEVGLSHTVSPGPYTLGKAITYLLTVTNNGPLPATGVVVTDQLDAARLQFVSASDAAYDAATGRWTVGSLAVGASRTLEITAKPLVTGSITASASQTHTEADQVAENNTAAVAITVVESADLEVSTSTPQTTYLNRNLIPFTLTAKNLGPNAATGVTVLFPLPAGLSLEGTPPTAYDAATGTWTIGNMPANGVQTITLYARATQTGAITTTANLGSRTGHQLDPVAGNNTASHTLTINPAADLALSSTVSNSSPNQLEPIQYTITVSNAGPNAATQVQVSNQVPAGLTLTGFEASAGTFDPATGLWQVGTVLLTSPQTLVLYARPEVTGPLHLVSSQTHTEPDAVSGNNTATASVVAGATADVALTNTISPVKSTYGNEAVTYTLTVTNNGPSTATNVMVTDQLPGAAFLGFNSAATSTGSASFDAGTQRLTWSVGSLSPGATATLTLQATINQSAVITTSASQTHTEYDNINGNNSASNSIVSGSGTITADIQVTTSANAPAYYTGDKVTFTVRATNQGPDAATAVNLAAALPAGFALQTALPKVGSYENGIWTIPALANGAYTELILVGTPLTDPLVSGDKVYTFQTERTGAYSQFDPDATDNSHSTAITVHKQAEVGASIQVSSNAADGKYYHNLTEATFEITITNHGPDLVTNLKGTDTRTGTINFTSVQVPVGMNYNPATGALSVDALAPGASLTLVVKGIPNTTGRLNLGGIKNSADQYDAVTANDIARGFIQVLPVADLQVTNTAPTEFYNGETISFTVTVQNNGPDAATSVQIFNPLPEGLNFVSTSASSGSYDPASGLWTLNSDLLPGAANAQTLVLTVKPQAAASYSTTASVASAGEYDNLAANNSQQALIQGHAAADVTLTSSITAGPYYVGMPYTITLLAENLGPDAATGVVVTGQVPANLLVLEAMAPAGSTYDLETHTWNLGNLALGETQSLALTVTPITLGNISYSAYKSFSNEYDGNGGNSVSYNNSTVIKITASDRPATVEVVNTGKHYFFFHTGQLIARITDPDGDIQQATLVSGTLPAGVRLLSNGLLEVDYKYALVPGDYSLAIQTIDAHGRSSENILSYSISGDWDQDGVADADDIDDNNDGIITDLQAGGVNPTGDEDQDGTFNYLDRSFVHPVYGAFRDVNGDDIHDAFDLDLDGMIRGFDVDIDGDGITNVIEANGGAVPPAEIYNPLTGTIVGGVSSNGMPLAVQTSPNSGVSIFANPDSDGDGRRDFEDLDADNDGIKDLFEAQATQSFVNKALADADRDGLNDAYDPSCGCGNEGLAIVPVNKDGQDLPDYLDLDTDNDGLEDFVEAFDDNQDTQALDDLKVRAALFENATGAGIYTSDDADADGVPNWLEVNADRPAYLVKGTAYYRDLNQDGLIDLFDATARGRAPTLQTSSVSNEYNFRSATELVTLPVTLMKFAGAYREGQVYLTWQTASEKNNQAFLVEKSLDGKVFEQIGQVKGAGNSRQVLRYGFEDVYASPGINYYRLKQVDLDGAFEYSPLVAVAVGQHASKALVQVFPNPAREEVQVDLRRLEAGNWQVEVYSVDGRLVNSLALAGGRVHALSLVRLPAGKYLIRIQDGQRVFKLSLLKL